MLVVVEKEIWPNTFRAVRRRGAPIIVANGTISERTFRRYKRFRGVFSEVLSMIGYFCARTRDDLERAISSGISPDNAEVLGNLKFDLKPPPADPGRLEDLGNALGTGAGPLVVAGSTHEGEEEIILGAFRKLREGSPAARLVIAPRHPERFSAVEGMLKRSGLAWARRSKAGNGADAAVVMLDTVGELMHAYSFADVAVVGGSLVPGIGGHNLLEPAYYGHPVVYGGFLTTYAGMADMLEEAGGGVRVKNERELAGVLADLLADEVKRKRMGTAALGVVEANKGAAERTVKVIERYLPKRDARPGGV
jgi:3-deoxy-D-manno-octulosonic-acid transferase